MLLQARACVRREYRTRVVCTVAACQQADTCPLGAETVSVGGQTCRTYNVTVLLESFLRIVLVTMTVVLEASVLMC